MFRILLDEETVGARQFALLINEFDPGLTSTAHKHDKEEQAFYIISGTGVIRHRRGEDTRRSGRCGFRASGQDAPNHEHG